MFNADTYCTLAPYFEVQDGQLTAFKDLAARFTEIARTEPGCMHYTYAFNGNTAYCREGYDSAEAILAHIQNVGALFDEALKVAKLVRLEVHAPLIDIEKLQAPLAALNPSFFALEGGIRRTNLA
jgi:quinol monooxygenase YgiN